MSSKLFDVGRLYLSFVPVYIASKYNTTFCLINSDVIGIVEMGHRSVCFDVRQTEYDII